MVKKRFDQRLESIPSQLWTKIAQIDELKGRWIAGVQLNTHALARLNKLLNKLLKVNNI